LILPRSYSIDSVLCSLLVGSGVHSYHGRASGVAAFGVLVGLAVGVSLLTEDATRHIRQAAGAPRRTG
jgi:hypothetical protein